jgi:hypothetical protein
LILIAHTHNIYQNWQLIQSQRLKSRATTIVRTRTTVVRTSADTRPRGAAARVVDRKRGVSKGSRARAGEASTADEGNAKP